MFGIQRRLVIWLLVLVLPVFAAAWVTTTIVEHQLINDAEQTQLTLANLESARIDDTLSSTRDDASSVASRAELIAVLDGSVLAAAPAAAERDQNPARVVLEGIVAEEAPSALGLEAISLLDRSGLIVGMSTEARLPDVNMARRAMDERSIMTGRAVPSPESAWGSLRMTVPIAAWDHAIVGAVELTLSLDRVLEPVSQFTALGDSSEAYLVQQSFGADAEGITLRRFDRAAAYQRIADGAEGEIDRLSLTAAEAVAAQGPDYRGTETIAAVSSVEGVDWGLVVKVDRDEALRPLATVQRVILISLAVIASTILLAWFVELQPLGRRLSRVAVAADRVAGGEYQDTLNDTTTDELGRIADSIDRLATDLVSGHRDRLEVEAELERQRRTDEVTGLATRRVALSMLRGGQLAAKPFALVFVDLDRLHDLTAAHGDDIGDRVLRDLAQRTQRLVGDEATVARWSQSEFVAIVPEPSTVGIDLDHLVSDLEQRLTDVLREPVRSPAGVHRVGVTVGLAVSGGDRSAGDILAEARAEVRSAQHSRVDHHPADPRSLKLVEAALEAGRVEVFYQPVVTSPEADSVDICGVEALVRLRSVDGELIAPGNFLPGLGASEVGRALDLRVIETALADLASWRRRKLVHDDFRVAFNLGSALAEYEAFVDDLRKLLTVHHLPAHTVLVEMPETVGDVNDELITGLNELGVRMAIDDVGCQFSNIERMVDMPADVAKIDRRWTMNIGADENEEEVSVLRSLVHICHLLDFEVIAEGVEAEHQAEVLRSLGVRHFQGFHFGRPMPLLLIESKLSQWRDDDEEAHREASTNPVD